jgi:two-component system, chemotaxis family, sensor kinase CheA
MREQIDDESAERLAAILKAAFQDEAYELVSELEGALLELEKTPGDAELIARVFRALHTIKGSAAACGLTDVSSFSHEAETPFDLIRKGRLAATKEVVDLALSACDRIKAMFDACYRGGTAGGGGKEDIIAAFRKLLLQSDETANVLSVASAEGESAEQAKNLGEILLERGDVSSDDLHAALGSRKRLGETLVEQGKVSHEQLESALAEQQRERELLVKRREAQASSSIRVSAEKLDRLIDLVGELVTVQTRLSRIALTSDTPDLPGVAEEVERLTAELRESTMSVRMLPFGTIFGKFQRLVRDLSADLGKRIELVTGGAETELDKTVIERLNEPLVHLIRNSLDHGIETPEAREAAGKPRTGTIHLTAVHAGAHVLIIIKDDGAGLDKEAIRARALEKGLISKDAELPERELLPLVLAPGFSTAKSVTEVSGRGVGLDVVKRTIDGLRGSIVIESRQGIGATITLKLPLTLAIIDGFLTRIGDERFVFPLSLVEECMELTRKDENARGRRIVNVRGRALPYISLRDQFLVKGERPEIEQIVIVRVEEQRVGFVVDTVIGEHQTVIKNLGKFYREVDGISGATVLGDGTVALILDVPKLAKLAEQEENLSCQGK